MDQPDVPHRRPGPPRLRFTRRKLLRLGGAGLLIGAPSVLLGGSRVGAAPSEVEPELVFACDGGSTQRVFETQIFPAFTKRHGIKITYVPGQPANTLAKMRAQRANPSIDVAWLAGAAIWQSLDEGLLAEIDRSLVPNFEFVTDRVGSEKMAAPVGITVCALTSNTDVWAKRGFPAVTSWFDMWDTRYKGHVGCYSITVTSTVAFVSKIAQILTGDYKNADAAYAKFRELRPNMLDYYPSAGAYETAMQQGDVWIGMNTAVRGMQMKNDGMPIATTIPREGTVGYQTWLGLVKNAKHPKAAHAFIDFMLSTEAQQSMVRLIGYSPVNRQASVPAELASYFPDLDTVLVPDWRYLGTQIPKYVDRWNREIER
jgi:putative spermidine/putrescine transport system substrate-binding protein